MTIKNRSVAFEVHEVGASNSGVLRVSTTSHIIQLINAPFPYQRTGTPAEYKAGLEHAIAKS